MPNLQSSTALELGTDLPHSAALQPEHRLSQKNPDMRATREVREREVLLDKIEEDAGLDHDVRNLLSALQLYSELMALPGVLCDGYTEYAGELRLLSERSRNLMTRLMGGLNRSAMMDPPRSVSARERGGRSFRLVEAEAGWIAC
jgi:signal transduction histidine kinase